HLQEGTHVDVDCPFLACCTSSLQQEQLVPLLRSRNHSTRESASALSSFSVHPKSSVLTLPPKERDSCAELPSRGNGPCLFRQRPNGQGSRVPKLMLWTPPLLGVNKFKGLSSRNPGTPSSSFYTFAVLTRHGAAVYHVLSA
ncbi:unnamed protein product, partial [Ectocarpus sp. 12 AP-2014]